MIKQAPVVCMYFVTLFIICAPNLSAAGSFPLSGQNLSDMGEDAERYQLSGGFKSIGEAVNLRTVHKYSAYATLGAAALTGLSTSSHEFHCNAAKGTTILATVTVLSGLARYGFPAIDRSNILSPRILHRLMGTAGLIGCATAVYLAENNGFSSHPSFGITGAGLMAASVVIIKYNW